MPTAPARTCNRPGCGKLNCTTHRDEAIKAQRAAFDRTRRNDPYRWVYSTARWKRTRVFILTRDPLCKIAKLCVQRFGLVMPSTEADHIIKLRVGVDPFDPENLQGACHACHSAKTAAGG